MMCPKCGKWIIIGPGSSISCQCNRVKPELTELIPKQKELLKKFQLLDKTIAELNEKRIINEFKVKIIAQKVTKRPTFQQLYTNFASALAQRSTCQRLSVGCVVTSEDYSHVYGVGYNGNAKGFPNKCDSDEPGNCGCLHAEENALLKVNVPSTTPKVAFITHQPCAYCAKRIVNKGGFKKVYYVHPYRLPDGLNILKQAGIATEMYDMGNK